MLLAGRKRKGAEAAGGGCSVRMMVAVDVGGVLVVLLGVVFSQSR